MDFVKSKVARQCSVLFKMRHVIHRKHLLRYHNTYVKPAIQYGILDQCCARINILKRVHLAQKRLARIIIKNPRFQNCHHQNKFYSE